MKKKVAIIGLIILILAYIVFSAIIYAGNQVVYVGLNTTFSNGDGYGIGDPTNGGIGIWNLRNYDSTDRNSESTTQRELYCLKGQYGDTWNTNAKTIIEYDLPYNLQTEREKVLELLKDSGTNTANDVVTEILDDSNTGAYKQLLWVMDNLFIPGKSDKDKLLEKIGILYDDEYDVYEYKPVEGYDYSDKVNELEYYYTLTETDIKAVQQAVIWYYTNAVIDGNKAYDNTDATDWLTLTMNNGSTYQQLFDYNRATTGEGPARYEQAHILYNYLIDSAEKNASNYTSDGYLKPVEINISGLTKDINDRYQIESNRNATNYIYGPITINKNNDLDYNIILNVSDLSGTSISSSNYAFTNSTGTVIANDVNALVGRDEGFYISIPKTVAKGINIDISVSYNTKTKILWLSEKENGTTYITVNAEQPVVEIEETTNSETVKFTSIPKEFDLALRKYITAVNGTTVTDTRVPNIDLSTLQSGTTATYKHRKDPVVIKNGDIVTYKITVYNEGEKNGYASEIIDQLPEGLKYVGGSTITSNKNTYSVTYNETTNRVVFTNTTKAALNKYATNSLDSETLEFTCEVTAIPDTENDKILTNVAWINRAHDSESNIEITEVGDDRDSRPQTYPSVSSTEIEGFKGNSSNKTDLTDSTYHYAGEQDDDDFEKLVLEPEIQITVTKAWEDNNDQDGLRPEEVNVSLYANEMAVEGKTVTLSDENNWTYTFTNLPLKNNGTAITYSVKETTGITGYSIATYGSVEEGFTITNTHVPTTVDISVQKNWEDANNQDGIRATSITVNLLANGTAVEGKSATLNESNSWKYTFTDLPEYKDGSKITYTISEPSVPEGYESQITGDAASGFTITNTHTPETIDIPVTKVWEDNDNQDGIRPTEISVSLKNGNTTVETVTLNESNNWKYTFTDLPKNSNGTEITYTVVEEGVPEDYTSEITGDMTSGYTITNTYEVEKISVSVMKEWDDENDQDGIRPTSIDVNLKNGDTIVDTVILNEENNWTHTFTDLPKKSKGTEIIYTVEEDGVPEGYTTETSGNMTTGYKITNTHIPETIDIPVTKVWNDENNQDGIRPSEISVSLKNGDTTVDTAVLNEENNWTHTFADLPKNTNGTEIEYIVVENGVPEGYTTKATGDKTTGYTITNTHIPKTISVPVEKVWEDNNNQDGIRSTEITVKLLANGTEVEGKTATLNENNSWKYTFTDLPEYQNGSKVTYSISELSVPEGYDSKIEGNMTTGYTITNIHVPETISIPVTKVWNDNNNQDGKRPTEITITLYADNQEVDGKSIKLNESNSWKYTYTDLPKNQNGTEITYTVEETGITQGYTSKTEGSVAEGFIITNTYTPEIIDISVTKIWNDNNNQDGLRPTEITVQLYGNETEIDGKSIKLNESNNWKYTFENLPKYENGESITYTVQESGVPTGYSSLISGSMNTGYIITNTYTPGTTSVKVTKVWDDNNNQDGLRPEAVSVSLLADEEVVETIDLNESNNWQYTFTDLPVKENGEDIVYTVTENTEIEGYTTQITKNNVIAEAGEIQTVSAPEYTITNTHETEEISITVTKVWNDENDYDKIRPESITVNIKNGEKIVETVTLSADNNWIHTFENLPAKENGETINYVIEEIEPEGYTADITKDENEENKYIITNTHIPDKPFDLALRKYIIKINNNELRALGLSTRVPNISTENLEEEKTANYRHRKDPVKVEEGDIVTYAITIYNEGEKAGYASQIIDQLPSGLIYNPSGSITSKDSTGADKNTYTVDYESTTNKVIFDIINTTENPAKELQPYGDELDYETIEIKCKVVYRAVAGKENILTNVAWINKAFDVEDDKEITSNVGDDRDSEPNTKPNVSKEKIEDYKGNKDNKDDLTDDTYHYKGEQDDDDFEKIYVKTNDLSLRKYIDKVNGKELEESREPVVDVSPLQNGEGTTAIYKHPKTPVALKVGDTVLYTIRIYNEGENAGYANEVKDYLPPYLEYLKNSKINEQYGWKVSEDGRVVTTTYLSNKKIDEFNGIELDYEDIQIECKISRNAIPDERITNIAEISEYKNSE